MLLLTAVTLTGCWDSVPTETQPEPATVRSLYTGPAPATADVQAFMTNFWDNVKETNRCGSCHGAGGQAPEFARADDVNLAYAQAISVVDLTAPADSRVVTKVSGGHNCWLSSNSACGAVLAAYVEAWATGAGVTVTGNTIELEAPALRDAGSSKTMPEALVLANVPAEFDGIYDLLTDYCSSCHAETAAIPQAPYFASSDKLAAYNALRSSQKIDLDSPELSRLVVRLREEFHNCWDDCAANAQEMEDAIQVFADSLVTAQVDASWVLSKALSLTDGTIASGGSRYEANLIALYEFKTGSGNSVYDTSGVEPALHLTLSGTENTDYRWVGGWGVEFVGGKAQGTTAASKKLADFIKASGEYSIEAWVVPGNVTQEGPARIISYSAGTANRNFTLGQSMYNYDFLQRSSTTDGNGEPALSTADADQDLQATLQHVVATYDPVNGRRLYVNGEYTQDQDTVGAGNLNDWDDSFAFVLGNEVSSNRPWRGTLRLVAIHNRALTTTQIQQNFAAGVGERYFLLFSVSHLIDVPQSYILFEVSQFDSYSYLFNKPTFISLDPTAVPGTIPIQGMHIGINGKLASVGQAYRTLDTTITTANYVPGAGQVLSEIGTVIALEQGAQSDEFFLTFDVLGTQANVISDSAALDLLSLSAAGAQSDIGLRTFDEINTTMAAITGVATTQSDVSSTFATIKQQLPTVANIDGFLVSHQIAVAQLAIEYCNALVEDTSLRASFFPGFNFSASAASAFDTVGERNLVIDPIIAKVSGSNLSVQPADGDVSAELNDLIDTLTTCGGACAADRTETVVKGVCAAALGSAVMLVQ